MGHRTIVGLLLCWAAGSATSALGAQSSSRGELPVAPQILGGERSEPTHRLVVSLPQGAVVAARAMQRIERIAAAVSPRWTIEVVFDAARMPDALAIAHPRIVRRRAPRDLHARLAGDAEDGGFAAFALVFDRSDRVVGRMQVGRGLEELVATIDATSLPHAPDIVDPERWLASALAEVVAADAGEQGSAAHALSVLEALLHACGARRERIERLLIAALERFPEWLDAAALTRWLPRPAARFVRPLEPTTCELGFVVASLRGDLAAAHVAAFAWIEALKGLPTALARLADRVAESALADSLRQPESTALALALALAPDDRSVLRQSWRLHADRGFDLGAATRIGKRLVATFDHDVEQLNSFAWELLTEARYARRFDALALQVARSMAHHVGWRTAWRVDTLALAEFENGHVRRAIELQTEAVEGADRASEHRYRARLERYLATGSAGLDRPGPAPSPNR